VVLVRGFAFDLRHHSTRSTGVRVLALNAVAPHESLRPCPMRILTDTLFHRGATKVAIVDTIADTPETWQQPQSFEEHHPRAASVAKIGLVGSLPVPAALSPMERWCVDNIEGWYEQALAWKCPFLRRRASDLLDAADMLMRFLVIRNTNLLGPPPSLRGVQGAMQREKTKYLTREELLETIRSDWRSDNNKGYYITGRLSTNIYRDDCVFDGPDPDMPVKGLRKYLNAASQLFDQRTSRAELLGLQIDGDVIRAKWRFNGSLRLPWKPIMPEVTGTTIYHMDEDGLIYSHEETWDMSAYQAFFWTMMPQRFASPNARKAVKKHLQEALLFV